MKNVFFTVFLLTVGNQIIPAEQQDLEIVPASENAVKISGDVEKVLQFINLGQDAVHEKDTIAFGLDKHGQLSKYHKTEKVKLPLSVFVQAMQNHDTRLCESATAVWQKLSTEKEQALEESRGTIQGLSVRIKELEGINTELQEQVIQLGQQRTRSNLTVQQGYSGKTVLLSGALGMGITVAAFKLGFFESASKVTSSWW